MENKKLYWVIIKPEYLEYLKKIDARIPDYDYGKNHLKPFFGILMKKDGLCYVSQVNHYVPQKHDRMPYSTDFQKIYDFEYKKMISAVSLNYMFPVPESCMERMKYREIDNYVDFKDHRVRYNLVNLLKKTLHGINGTRLSQRAEKVYRMQTEHIKNSITNRCLDFKALEQAAKEYIMNEEQDITEMAEGTEITDIAELIRM